jgi:hypothetical protein
MYWCSGVSISDRKSKKERRSCGNGFRFEVQNKTDMKNGVQTGSSFGTPFFAVGGLRQIQALDAGPAYGQFHCDIVSNVISCKY